MKEQPHRLKWHILFAITILGIAAGIYSASQTINYNWQWHRVLPYIVDTSPVDIIAQGDGSASINNNSLTITYDNGAPDRIINNADTILVSDGDIIFEGDLLARQENVRMGVLIEGLLTTLEISVISLFFSLFIGLVAALMRISNNPFSKNLSLLYVEVIRGTPLLVQIFIVYFFLGTVFDLERFTAGIVALSVFTGAYVAEILRSGIQSISPGQMEAARSLGMTYPKAMMYVILPQAFKRTLPPMASQLINLIKDSSLVSVISITDLTKAGREVVSGSFATFEVWFTVAALYLLLTSTLSWAIQRIEKRLANNG
ncbi:amino acid ABC transporter permease [Psychromonas sp. 14N.309.X.WAT.B.A12]|uniref:amino acid ABC transporter permease n=1 Tax=unclassified Psychromonas TaxID=2614957 RepID=UPI0025AFD99F|nr:amino acid ABC transporter permease [Psychromonas sp. 14N.309.X.WAT.B.A12]MDN2664560.1 amino acid ABC transporter permease [Psychromonas sp. 14N.309.X.WAT.B.A12]